MAMISEEEGDLSRGCEVYPENLVGFAGFSKMQGIVLCFSGG